MEVPNILSIVTYLPAAAAVLLLLFPRKAEGAVKAFALAASLVTFLVSLHLYFHFDPANGGMQFEEWASWIEGGLIRHHLGIDGISLYLILLTTFLTPLAILSSWRAISRRVKPFIF
jgi:NADH-quinone oxidoreductase subunit M